MDLYNCIAGLLLAAIGYYIREMSIDIKHINKQLTDIAVHNAVTKEQTEQLRKDVDELQKIYKHFKPATR